MDLRRHAELVYRFLGVGSVPDDTLAWIEKNNAAKTKAKETGFLVKRDRSISLRYNESRSRYVSPYRSWKRRRRIEVPDEDEDENDDNRFEYKSLSENRRVKRRVPNDGSVFGSRYLSPSENLRLRKSASADVDLSRSRYLSSYQRLVRQRRNRVPADDDAYVTEHELRSEKRRTGRRVLANVFKSRYLSPSENLKLRRLTPVKDDASKYRYVKYESPLEKWKRRLTPADSAAIVNNEICREYFRLARTNPD